MEEPRVSILTLPSALSVRGKPEKEWKASQFAYSKKILKYTLNGAIDAFIATYSKRELVPVGFEPTPIKNTT